VTEEINLREKLYGSISRFTLIEHFFASFSEHYILIS